MPDRINRSPDLAEFVIQGITKDGQVFRPSNWGERLSDMLSTTDKNGKIIYSSYLRPMVIQGISSAVVRFSLEMADPHAFDMVRKFVSLSVPDAIEQMSEPPGYFRPSAWNGVI